MKRAVILHGTSGSPDQNWFPWLKQQLESSGYQVWVPSLPDNQRPSRKKYETFLQESDWDFTDNLLIGHSSGATTVLNLLMADWFPGVDTVVLVGVFLNEKLLEDVDWYEKGQFDDLFVQSFDSKKIKSKAGRLIFVHGSDDPFCDVEDAKHMASSLQADFIEIQGGKHLSAETGTTRLPEILDALG